ncbi:HCP-like protein [Neocallimastix californiae]|uniref:HCP-like protein n=1 Tax=Neocallimastix californiae TaxID=1754190 RepID=A0A1Y2AH62_9FUNG|nr:HCP-like protein [Neocallimastix californiae]|eukprot:ORY21919.1 HCP-like protein [Neocallimastix californiae]
MNIKYNNKKLFFIAFLFLILIHFVTCETSNNEENEVNPKENEETNPIEKAKEEPIIAKDESQKEDIKNDKIDESKEENEGYKYYEQAMKILEDIPDKKFNGKPKKTFVGILTNAFKKITGKPEFKYYEKPKIKDRYFDLNEEISDNETDNTKRLMKALNLLEKAGLDYNLEEALEELTEITFFARHGAVRNMPAAFKYINILCTEFGNADALYKLGLIYSTGLGGVVDRDQAKALMYYTFSALNGNKEAEMVLGYRYMHGIGTARNCEEAVMDYLESGPPLGRVQPHPKLRLSDEDGGIFGLGASGSGDKKSEVDDVKQSLPPNDVVQFYKYSADGENGDAIAQHTLGRIFYYGIPGIPGIPVDYEKAFHYFLKAANQLPKSPLVLSELSEEQKKYYSAVSQSAGFIGYMYWRGEGVEQNMKKAREWLEKGDAYSTNYLGVMHREGVAGFDVNTKEASRLFSDAASKENTEAQINFGDMLLDTGKRENQKHALKYYQLAATMGNVKGTYRLGKLYLEGLGVPPHCEFAVTFLKSVCERANFEEKFMDEAYRAYKSGDFDTAILKYLYVAEQGYEVAQSNLAYIIDKEYFPTRSLFPHIDPYAVALINWNRAANQMNTDARVKVGDYFYYGLGTDDIGLIDDDSSEDLEELINTEKALKKEAESILNTFYGKDGIKNKEKDKDDNTSDSKNEKENEGNDKTKDTKVGTKEGKADSKDTKVNTDEGKGDSKDTKIITDEDKKESENVIAADADDKEDKEVKKSKKKKNSIFDIVIYLKSKFYIGHGTVLYKKAVANYQVAADLYSSIAMWNLGWMYENGVGVDTDLNLAKRYYDNALATNSEASVPVGLSLFKLNFKHMILFLKGEVPSMYIDNKPRQTVMDRLKQEKKRLLDLYEKFNNELQNQNNENGQANANAAGNAQADPANGRDQAQGQNVDGGEAGEGQGNGDSIEDIASQIEKILLEEIGDLENLLEIASITLLAALGAFLLWYRQMRFPQRPQQQQQQRNN